MSSSKCHILLLVSCCLFALAIGSSLGDLKETPNLRTLVRQERSPQHGSITITGSKDQAGRQAGVQYNHNLYTSGDGRGSIDAYANANRNFDYNRNDFGGGIQGRWRF